MNPVNLGKQLRAARKARGLTQQAAADLLGLTRTAVTQIEAGNRSAARSQRITYRDATMVAHCFGVSSASAVYHLTNLLSIPKEKSRRLLAQEEFGRKHLNMLGDEEDSAQVGYEGWTLRDEIAGLAIEAYRRELISRGHVMDLGRSLEASGEALLDLAEAACEK